MFTLDNVAIQYPHAIIERVPPGRCSISLLGTRGFRRITCLQLVPTVYLFVYAGALPLALILVYALIFRPSLQKLHVTILGLAISLILTSFLTDVVKNSVGRPRPDLLARCKAAAGTPQHELVTVDVCTETDHHTLHDGWRSFPSGHSSFAFSGLGYLALYAQPPTHSPGLSRVPELIRNHHDCRSFFSSQLHVFRPHADLALTFFALSPLLGALLIAISRCEDYRHDVYDVSVGSLLGMSIAYFAFRRYYPPLHSAGCETPLVRDKERGDSGSIGRRDRDEEEGDGETVPLRSLERHGGDG